MRWRSLFRTAVIAVLVPSLAVLNVPVAAQTSMPSGQADINALQGQFQTRDNLRGLTATVQSGMPGLGSTSDVAQFSARSVTAMGEKGAAQLTFCNNMPKASLTAAQQAECEGILTAAGISRNVINNGPAALSPEKAWATSIQKNSIAQGKTTDVRNTVMPTVTSTQAVCRDVIKQLPRGTREESCSASLAFDPRPCTETLSIKRTESIDPTTGAPTIIYEDVWSKDCAIQSADSTCELDEQQCTVGTLCREVDGIEICRPCWEKTSSYICYDLSAGYQSHDCDEIQARGCSRVRASCGLLRHDGMCVDYTYVYQCNQDESRSQTIQECTHASTCIGSLCFDTSANQDQDFASVMAGMEAGREAGVYMGVDGTQHIRIFKGISDNCTRPVGFMSSIAKNCCFEASGARNDATIMRGNSAPHNPLLSLVTASAVSWAGRSAYNIGAHYTYDFMWNSGQSYFQEKAFSALGSGSFSPDAGFTDMLANPSVGAYGLTIGTAPATASLVPGTIELGTTMVGDTQLFITFNPYVFAAMIIIHIIMELQTCSENEQLLAMRRGQGLCVHQDTWCSQRLPWPLKTCIQETESWCCWNSRLAKAIATQAGGVCNGFSPEEFAKVDFSKIDLSEFINEIKTQSQARAPTQAEVSEITAVRTPGIVDRMNTATDSSVQSTYVDYVKNNMNTQLPFAATNPPGGLTK